MAQTLVCDVCDMLIPAEAEGRTGSRSQNSRFQVSGSRCQTRIRDSGFGTRDSGLGARDAGAGRKSFCLLQLSGVRIGGTVAPFRDLRQDLIADRKRKS